MALPVFSGRGSLAASRDSRILELPRCRSRTVQAPRTLFVPRYAPTRRRDGDVLNASTTTSTTTVVARAVPTGGLPPSDPNRARKPQRFLGDGISTQEDAYDALASIAMDLLRERERGDRATRRVVVGLVGSPGSGKTTAASAVVRRINEAAKREGSSGEVAVVLPMDGFHLTKAELAASDDPEAMFARRGAHWTFDAEAFVESVSRVARGSDSVVAVPSFDHGVGDPCPGAIEVRPEHSIVVVEGNYLLLPLRPWSRLSGINDGEEGKKEPPLLDQTWFLDVGVEEAMERVKRRQLSVGVSPEASARRISGNDRPNAELVASTKGRADVVVRGDLPLRGGGGRGGKG